MKSFIKSNPVVSFIALSFLYSWTLWILMILSARELLPFKFPTNFLGSFGPAIGALVVIAVSRGKAGMKDILKSLLHWKVPLWTYVFAIFFIIAVYILTGIITYFIDPSIISFQKLPGFTELILYFIIIAIVGGPLGEELGWRGFLQPELLKRFNPAMTSIFIAIIWFIWHVPLFWLEGAAQEGGSILFFGLSVFAMAFLFTFLYIKSNGSLLLAILFHTMINYVSAFIIPAILPATETDKTFGRTSTVILIILAILIIIVFNKSFFPGQRIKPQSFQDTE